MNRNDLHIASQVAHYRALLESVYGDRAWVLAYDVMASVTGLVESLEGLGARPSLCLATSRGVGALPDLEMAPQQIIIDGGEADSLMEVLRVSMRLLEAIPAEVQVQVDAFVP